MSSYIYLDNAATTKPLSETAEVLRAYGDDLWFNPSALYGPAVRVRREVEGARDELGRAFGRGTHNVVFTSGGTESANMVIRFGVRRRKGMNFVCAGFEHPCVEESFRALADAGEDVRFVPTDATGAADIEKLLKSVDKNTALVSVMHVNNETGAINDISAIASAVKHAAPGSLFHSDGVQAFLRVPPADTSQIDYYTVSAHKVHGLKGTGAVFFRQGTPLKEMLRGGGQEHALRSGTENAPGILCFGKAVSWFMSQGDETRKKLEAARGAFLEGIRDDDNVQIVSPPERSAPHITALFVKGVRGETLMHSLESEGIYISTGSACSSKKGKSRAARALGITQELASGMIRVSFSPFTEPDEASKAAEALLRHAAMLRL